MVAKQQYIWMDGHSVAWDDANVHILTHALHYGLGVFEGIRCYQREDGRSAIFRLREHIDRLFASAHIMLMKIPYTREEVMRACVEILVKNNMKEGYLRPLAYSGEGDMGVGAVNPTRLSIAAWYWGAYLGEEGLKNGIRAKVSSYTRYHVNMGMAKGKITGQYINSILAKREARNAGYNEAILLDHNGHVAEGSGENLFMVRNGVLYTPPFGSSILSGITRETVMILARELGIEVREESFSRDILYIADEIFFTGTAAELTPIREVDDRTIGEGRPGPVTKKLQEAFFAMVKGRSNSHPEWFTYLES